MSELAYRFPNAHRKAVVMSYDDGSEHDRRLVGLFNRYGIRAYRYPRQRHTTIMARVPRRVAELRPAALTAPALLEAS